MSNWLGRIATPVLVAIVFAAARRYLPVSSDVPNTAVPPLTELDKRFHLTSWIFSAGMLCVGLAIFFALHQALVTVNGYFASLDGPAEFVLFPETATWYFLPAFAALTMSWDISLWVWSSLGSKQTASLYEYWSNAKAGFNATRVLRIFALVIALPVAILTGLALPEHDSLTINEIRSHRYGFSPTKVFSYSDAKSLTVIEGFQTRDGKLVKRAGCVAYFSDGRRWSSADIGDFKLSIDPTLVAFLQGRTGLPVTYSTTEAERPHKD